MKLKTSLLALIAASGLCFVAPLRAGDHPEHPKKTEDATKSEHPKDAKKSEHPKKEDGANKEGTLADISAGIKKHIEAENKKSADGKMHLNYEGKDLVLDLVKVHDDRLSSLGGSKYFACVDMKATDGTVYDIDFFLAGAANDMKVTDTSVHKISGKALYNWEEQKDGSWKKVEAKS